MRTGSGPRRRRHRLRRPDRHGSTGERRRGTVRGPRRPAHTGSQQYRDAPVNSAEAVDGRGQESSSRIAGTAAGPGFTGTTTLSAGDTALGYVTFKVPEEPRITEIQFTMNSGFADDTGEWRVP
jgi:hypothetical protein